MGHLFLKAQILPLDKNNFYNSISFYYAEKLKTTTTTTILKEK